jgi:hypothetical protein
VGGAAYLPRLPQLCLSNRISVRLPSFLRNVTGVIEPPRAPSAWFDGHPADIQKVTAAKKT